MAGTCRHSTQCDMRYCYWLKVNPPASPLGKLYDLLLDAWPSFFQLPWKDTNLLGTAGFAQPQPHLPILACGSTSLVAKNRAGRCHIEALANGHDAPRMANVANLSCIELVLLGQGPNPADWLDHCHLQKRGEHVACLVSRRYVVRSLFNISYWQLSLNFPPLYRTPWHA